MKKKRREREREREKRKRKVKRENRIITKARRSVCFVSQ